MSALPHAAQRRNTSLPVFAVAVALICIGTMLGTLAGAAAMARLDTYSTNIASE